MSKIIFLNGCGSSGKSSIARSIQYLSQELWLTFGIDTFISMTPFPSDNREETRYFNFIAGKNERGPTMRVEIGPRGHQLFGVMPDFAKLLTDQGHNIIIDEVLLDQEMLKSYAQALQKHTVYFIGVFCELNAMQEREFLRGDRAIGLSNDQIDRVHAGKKLYDLKCDTTRNSPFEVAEQILFYIKTTPHPQGFKTMYPDLE